MGEGPWSNWTAGKHDFQPTGRGQAYEACGFDGCTEPSWSNVHTDLVSALLGRTIERDEARARLEHARTWCVWRWSPGLPKCVTFSSTLGIRRLIVGPGFGRLYDSSKQT